MVFSVVCILTQADLSQVYKKKVEKTRQLVDFQYFSLIIGIINAIVNNPPIIQAVE